MSMKAIYQQRLWHVGEDDGDGVILEALVRTSTEWVYAPYAAPDLIIDPTDDDVADFCYHCGQPWPQGGWRACAFCTRCGRAADT